MPGGPESENQSLVSRIQRASANLPGGVQRTSCGIGCWRAIPYFQNPDESGSLARGTYQARVIGTGACHGDSIITVCPIARIASLNVVDHHSCVRDCVACSSIAKQSNQKNTGGPPSFSRESTNERIALSTSRNLKPQACEKNTFGVDTWRARARHVTGTALILLSINQ